LRRYDIYLLAILAAIETARRLGVPGLDRLLGCLFGSLAFQFSHHKYRAIETNLTRAFGDTLTAKERRALAHRIFVAYWQELFSWSKTPEYFSRRASVRGIEHLEQASASGKGVILWESNGFGTRVAGQSILAAHGIHLTQIHTLWHLGGLGAGDADTSWIVRHLIHPYFDRLERSRVSEVIYLPTDSSLAFTRTLFRRLRANAALCIAAEGHAGQKQIELEFLGQPCQFSSGVPSLSLLSGAPIVPFFCTPAPDGGYTLEILPALEHRHPSPTCRAESLFSAYLGTLESAVRSHPEWYRHWDTFSQHPSSPAGS
jgi:KDO2-lipid IV(A) lauroyltransferase